MEYTITRFNIRNTLLLADEGHTSYRVDTPWSWGTRYTKVTKIGDDPEVVGEIEWNLMKPTLVKFGGQVTERKEFLRESALGGEGTVSAPDGKEYIWKGMWSTLKLVSKDDENIVLAHYKSRNMLTGKKAMLVVEEVGMPILHFILVTFILVEKIRRERVEKSAGAAAGS